jgi:trigger factor
LQLQTVKQPGSQLDLTFVLEAADVARAFDKVFGELAQQGNIPGFRPGKAPAALLRRRFKPEMVRDMAWMRIMEDFVEPELQKDELQLVGEPEFPDLEAIELVEGEGVEFTLRIAVRPTPELPELTELKLHRIVPEVTDDDVAAELERIRETFGEEQPVEDRTEVAKGDLVEAQVQLVMDGDDEPASPTEQTLEIGSGRYNPPVDEDLVGHGVGETVDVAVDYPDDFENEELAGRKGTLKVEIVALKTRVLPELDDEFAREKNDYADLAEMKVRVREDLEKKAATQSRQTLENAALGAVVQGTTMELPEVLIDQLGRRSLQSYTQNLEKEGLSLESFMEITGVDEETLLQNERSRAEMGLRVDFVLEALEKAQSIEVSEADIEAEMELFAAENSLEMDFLRNALELQEGFREQLEGRAKRRLTIASVIEQAQVEDVTAEQYREIKEAERQAREAEEAATAATEEAAGAGEGAEAAEAEAVADEGGAADEQGAAEETATAGEAGEAAAEADGEGSES